MSPRQALRNRLPPEDAERQLTTAKTASRCVGVVDSATVPEVAVPTKRESDTTRPNNSFGISCATVSGEPQGPSSVFVSTSQSKFRRVLPPGVGLLLTRLHLMPPFLRTVLLACNRCALAALGATVAPRAPLTTHIELVKENQQCGFNLFSG